MDSKELIEQMKSKDKWIRVLYMLLFGFATWLARIVLIAIIVLQLILVLIFNKPNENLLNFSQSLSQYLRQIYLFLAYNTEEKPYPFSDWPDMTR